MNDEGMRLLKETEVELARIYKHYRVRVPIQKAQLLINIRAYLSRPEPQAVSGETPIRYSDTGDRRRVQPHEHGEYVLFADYRSLERRLREAEQDAERYRLVRDLAIYDLDGLDGLWGCAIADDLPSPESQIDDQCDAALRSSRAGEEGK